MFTTGRFNDASVSGNGRRCPVGFFDAGEEFVIVTSLDAARRADDETDSVLIFLNGDRSKPLYGRLAPTDARRLAALLMASAEPSAPKKPAN